HGEPGAPDRPESGVRAGRAGRGDRRRARAGARHGEPRRPGRTADGRGALPGDQARFAAQGGDGADQAPVLRSARPAAGRVAEAGARGEPEDAGLRQDVKPLEQLTILDLSRVLACPFASMVLAELGARVIKVEQQDSGYYFACNRSKESITVNLRAPEGKKIVRELAAKADVVVENFPVGTLGRYGLDFASLSSLNPRMVYVSCTGFGQTGPYAEKKGYDTVFQAMGGLMSLTGEKGGGPVKPGLPVA